jgi:transcriptional regulator with XRE-family HTH domain
MDRTHLADFLRTRRAALQPEDVGIRPGRNRRTPGLRREEVSRLADLSVDYYARLEQPNGPRPSEQALASLARGLRLTLEERDHLFRLGGYLPPAESPLGDHVNPGMMRVFSGLHDSAALVVNHRAETLLQTDLAIALLGDDSRHSGLDQSLHHRWFTDPAVRAKYLPADHAERSRTLAAHLHQAWLRDGERSRTGEIVESLLGRSPEFVRLWETHPVPTSSCAMERLRHPAVGVLELHCQTLMDPDHSQSLLVFTASPGTESAEKLRLLDVVSAVNGALAAPLIGSVIPGG